MYDKYLKGEVITKPQESLLANMQERLIQTNQGTLVLSQTQQQQKQQQNTTTNAGMKKCHGILRKISLDLF